MTAKQLRYRRASPDDSRACHDLMWTSVVYLGTRQGSALTGTADDWWRSGESLHRLLAQLAAEWWVAEETRSGRLVGFARTIEREGLVELTDLTSSVRSKAPFRHAGNTTLCHLGDQYLSNSRARCV